MHQLLLQAKQLVARMKDGCMTSTAYDTSWFLRLKDRENALRFPSAYYWIRNRQHSDGSWGGIYETYHDRLISTLSAVNALSALGIDEDLPSIRKGLSYIQKNAHRLKNDEYETVGFELTFPTLLVEAKNLGLSIPYGEFEFVKLLAKEKLDKIPADWMYQSESPMVHSLECLGNRVEPKRLIPLVMVNGSIWNSPSASAYAAQYIDHPGLNQYLARVIDDSLDGGACNVKPFEIFEMAWSFYNFLQAEIRLEYMECGIDYLIRSWRPNGVGISSSGLMSDADDSSLTMKVIGMWGAPVDTGFLEYYYSKQGFLTFPYERNPSVSTNIHALDLLNEDDASKNSAYKSLILEFLYDTRVDNSYWKDKWHISPYYATAHALLSAGKLDPELAEGAVRWILCTQRNDGSWGIFQGTLEETSYCIQGLIKIWAAWKSPSIATALRKAVAFLEQNRSSQHYPEMWIGKGVYAPITVIESSIISALTLWKKSGLH